MNRSLVKVFHVAASILLFVVVFWTVWYGTTFFVLYEYIYGDYGGAWVFFALPIAFVAACGSVALFLAHVTGYRRISFGVFVAFVLFVIIVATAWILFAVAFLTPRPRWVPPPPAPAPQPQALEPEETAHDVIQEHRGIPRQ